MVELVDVVTKTIRPAEGKAAHANHVGHRGEKIGMTAIDRLNVRNDDGSSNDWIVFSAKPSLRQSAVFLKDEDAPRHQHRSLRAVGGVSRLKAEPSPPKVA